MAQNAYSEKTFDQDLLLLVLHVFDFLEKKSINQIFLKQMLTDALGYSAKTADLVHLLQSLLLIPEQLTPTLTKEILDANSLVGRSKSLDEYCMTIRHFSDDELFVAWPEFFSMIRNARSGVDYPAIFTAARHCRDYFKESESFRGIFRVLSEAPQYSEAFAYGQLDSKRWLLEETQKVWGPKWGTVFVLGGWIGVLPRMIFDVGIQTSKIRSFDIDDSANQAAELLNQCEVQRDWLFKASTLDITTAQYPTAYRVKRKDGSLCELTDSADMVINTSCEHLQDISRWWAQVPQGTRVVLQSNDGFHIPEHVACFRSLGEFSAAMNLTRIDFQGEKTLPEFNRFMLVGIK